MSANPEQAKQAVLDTWSEGRSGSQGTEGEPGTAQYVESLVTQLARYAPWKRDALRQRDSAGLDVLDVGCGQGIELVEFARAGARVTGVDLVPAHVEQARRNLTALSLPGTVVRGDAERLELPDRSFDRVISNNALQFTPDLDRALGELLRVLRPGGEARIIVYHRDSIYYWLHFVAACGILRRQLFEHRSMSEVVARNLPWNDPESGLTVRVHSRRGLRKRMRAAGFEGVATSVHGFAPEHSALTVRLAGRVHSLRDGRAAEILDRLAGWYIVGLARRPA